MLVHLGVGPGETPVVEEAAVDADYHACAIGALEAVDEDGLILGIADYFEGFDRILVLGVSETHRYMNVANAIFFRYGFFVLGGFALHSEIDYRFNTVLREYVDVVIGWIGTSEYSVGYAIEIIEIQVTLNFFFGESVLSRTIRIGCFCARGDGLRRGSIRARREGFRCSSSARGV